MTEKAQKSGKPSGKEGFFRRISSQFARMAAFVTYGVWEDTSDRWYIRMIKIINLSVRSFFDRDLLTQAYSLTYCTLLATVPVLAMIFAVANGFGFQNILRTQFFHYFPAQKEALEEALKFVDNYLSQTSEGLFVGVGIVVMIYTLVTLVWNVEDAFNLIWGVKEGRSLWRKVTDYTAIFLILPLLMICASGINILMSSTLQEALPFEFLSPLYSGALDLLSFVLTWLFFLGAYMLIPNTKVPAGNAMRASLLTSIGFMILQWLFVSGTVYVSRYNAIYGSFAFLPLLLVWLQFVWTIVLSGAVICYSSQNISLYNYLSKVKKISLDYRLSVIVAVLATIVKSFDEEKTAPDTSDISRQWGIPLALVNNSIGILESLGFINQVLIDSAHKRYGYAPAYKPEDITVGTLLEKIAHNGESDFIPGFNDRFKDIIDAVKETEKNAIDKASGITIRSLLPVVG